MIWTPRHSVAVCRRSGSIALVVSCLAASSALAQSGGFVESATDAGLRSRFSSAEIQAFLPERGSFTFPPPYDTTAVRLTNGSDCGGSDCVQPVGYSYWNNINNHVGGDTMLVFLGLERRKGGSGPTLFSVSKSSGQTRNLGPLFSQDSPYSWSTGEGWYFSATQPTTLYVSLPGTSALQRYDVANHTLTKVFDVSSRPDLFGSNRYIWQIHSSNDDRVHSATVKDSGYADLGCLAYREDTRQFFYYPQKGLNYDECQIDKSGRWLVIKEKTGIDPTSEVDNRIIDLETGVEQVLNDRNGAGGHSDTGFGAMLAADNFNPRPGAVRAWDFNLDLHGGEPVASVRGQGTLVYGTASWDYDVGHVSFGNAKQGVPLDQQYACSANASRKDLPRANEILCFRLDESFTTVIVAPNITDLNAPGGGTDDYWKYPKGNLDVTGEYFIWTANAGTNRLDAYIVRIPYQKLGTSPNPNPAPAPTPAPTPPPAPAPAPVPNPAPAPTPVPPAPPSLSTPVGSVRWTSLVNVSATADSLQKTSGCGGCPDATAVSDPQIAAGNGTLEFVPSETGTLRLIGLDAGGLATGPGDISFAIRLQGGTAEVREWGAYKAETSFTPGDTFRITVENSSVKYLKNGQIFFTSANPAGQALRVHAVLYDLNAMLRGLLIRGAPSDASSATTSNATNPSPSDGGQAQLRRGATPKVPLPRRKRP